MIRWSMSLPLLAGGLFCVSLMATSAAAEAAESTIGKQTTCPVSGKPIKQDVSVKEGDETIHFCCKGCIKKFKESPEQYLPKVYRQTYPQEVQVKCPVMGGTPDPEAFTTYKGQRIHYCCPKCDKKFQADPAKYIAKRDELFTRQVHCPVSGKAINPEIKLSHNGKDVYFCCKGCIKKFKADPAKFADGIRPEAGVAARGKTRDDDIVVCAVCLPNGEHRRADVKTIVYKGTSYFMCDDSCAKEFKENPDKHIKALAAEMQKTYGDKSSSKL